MPIRGISLGFLAALGLAMGPASLRAADFPAEDPKPFAEARVLLQLSDRDDESRMPCWTWPTTSSSTTAVRT